MNKWTKWLLAPAVVAITLAAVSPQSAEANWRRYWGGYGGSSTRSWARTYPRTLLIYPGGVNAFNQPPFILNPTPAYSPVFYRAPFPYASPYGGYYWRAY